MEECIPLAKTPPSDSKVIKLLILSKPSPHNKNGKKKKSTSSSSKFRKNATDNVNNDDQSTNSNESNDKKVQTSSKKTNSAKKVKLEKCASQAEENIEDNIQNKLDRILEDILYTRQMDFFRSPEVIEILQNLTQKQILKTEIEQNARSQRNE